MEEKVKSKTNGKRNRSAGHGFELCVVKHMKEHGFPHVVTSRSESRSRDNEGTDLINSKEIINGRLPYNIQCKNVCSPLKYPPILGSMVKTKGVTNVIFHKCTKRSATNFIPVGNYAILSMEDFLLIISELNKKK